MKDILSYESDIWSCADLLISSGIKQSKFPDYMMPFFALIMLEGRMRNEMADIEASEGLTRENNLQEFIEAFRDRECGYNDYIVREGKTLSTIAITTRHLSRISEAIWQALTEHSKNCSASSVVRTTANTSIWTAWLPSCGRKVF